MNTEAQKTTKSMHWYLVANYNNGNFLDEMLNSISIQYRNVDEFVNKAIVLIMDDGSSDESQDVLLRLSNASNVFAHRNVVNQGIGWTRNLLLAWCLGQGLKDEDLVTFVDADDSLPSSTIDNRIIAFEADPHLDCVGGQLLTTFTAETRPNEIVNTFPVDPEIEAIASLFECHFYGANASFKGRVFMNPAARFPCISMSEDWIFFAANPMRKRHIKQVTLNYRRHTSNATSRTMDQAEVFACRKLARTLGLLRIGMVPTDEDCRLLDVVGYLSFQLRWAGNQHSLAPEVCMPWFPLLEKVPNGRATWEGGAPPGLRQKIRGLFDRIEAHNDQISVYDRVKLAAFLNALLAAGDQAIARQLTENMEDQKTVHLVPNQDTA